MDAFEMARQAYDQRDQGEQALQRNRQPRGWAWIPLLMGLVLIAMGPTTAVLVALVLR